MTTTTPLIARSPDGSLIGIHTRQQQDSSSNNKTGLIRCYDGNVSNGSLKFTLRFPLSSNNDTLPSGLPPLSSSKENDGLVKLVFCSSASSSNSSGGNSPAFLCGMRQSPSSSILVWDLDRGVLATTVDVRSIAAAGGGSSSAKKKKKRTSMEEGKEVLCDIATFGNQLYALVFFPQADDDGSETGGKCRLYQYELAGGEVTLVKKIKVGSVPSSTSGSSFGVAISQSSIVVRTGNLLRVLDVTSGERLCKMDIPTAATNEDSAGDDDLVPFAPLVITSDGKYIATTSRSNSSQAMLFSCQKLDEGGHTLEALALVSSKDDSSPIGNLDLTENNNGKEVALVTFQPGSGIASLFVISTKENASTSLVPQVPKAQLQTGDEKNAPALVGASFHPRQPEDTLQLLFQRNKHSGGSAAGAGRTSLPMESLSYLDESFKGTITVGTSLLGDANKDGTKKRKAGSGSNIALAPGDQGQEASSAMDLTQKKKSKKSGDEGDENDDDFDDMEAEEEEGEQGQSIAERLALLSSAMEQTDEEDDEEDYDEDGNNASKGALPSKFKAKSATSETLTALLTQALSSNDMERLNVALQVTDRRLVEGTVRSLQALDAQQSINDTTTSTGYVPTLMAHIVRRMARRHSLVMPLGVWVRSILAATAHATLTSSANNATGDEMSEDARKKAAAEQGREMASKLGPLRNFLNERVECFPQLLRLEGRLALLNSQHQL